VNELPPERVSLGVLWWYQCLPSRVRAGMEIAVVAIIAAAAEIAIHWLQTSFEVSTEVVKNIPPGLS
jgi:GAF domain-containing protein